MVSQTVACHLAEVTFLPLTPAEAGTRFSDPGGLVSDVVEKTSTRRRSRIPHVVVEKKIKKVDELSTKILAIYLQQ